MMFFPESADPYLLKLLHQLMRESNLKNFNLGGGTSLALRFGHRKSVDLDFFSTFPFDTELLMIFLGKLLSSLEIVNRSEGSLCVLADGYKLDFLHHPYALLEDPLAMNDLRFLSLPDLAAMKINAVTNRGSRKDFVDLLMLHRKTPKPSLIRFT